VAESLKKMMVVFVEKHAFPFYRPSVLELKYDAKSKYACQLDVLVEVLIIYSKLARRLFLRYHLDNLRNAFFFLQTENGPKKIGSVQCFLV
jgi:hypothetical protein